MKNILFLKINIKNGIRPMKKTKKILTLLTKKEYAVAGIVVAVLLIALIISVVAIVQTVFVPRWMEQKEAEHMQNVQNQFAMLKYAIDTQAVTENSKISLTTSITLGNKGLPLLNSARSYGYLAVNRTKTDFLVKLKDQGEPIIQTRFGFIKYASQNSYYINKEYLYEAGALIIRQNDGNVMAVTPNFDVNYDGDTKTINMTFNLINTVGIGDRISLGGYGTFPIQVRYKNSQQTPLSDIEYFQMPTSNTNAWKTYFNRTLRILPEDSFSIEIIDNSIKINFDSTNYDVNLNLCIFNVDVQIAPGWIE
jgi:cell division protein FtsL